MGSERAHPEDSGFRDRIVFRRLGGIIPIPWIVKNPYKQALKWRYEAVNRLAHGKRVLDIPCGMGWGTSLIRSASTRYGLDCDPEAVAEAVRRYGKRIEFAVGDMAKLDFDDGTLDMIACLEGIEHVDKETGSKFLEEASRVLTGDGTLVISSPHTQDGSHSGNPWHVHEYSPAEIEESLEVHFTILKKESKGTFEFITDLYVCTKKEAQR